MRHRVYGKHFGRNKNERQALFKSLVYSLLSYGTIETSEVKAKAIKGMVDKLINSVKKDVYNIDQGFKARIKEILPKLGNKTSGYTSMVRIGTRLGDQTTMIRMSLIGAEELKPAQKAKTEPKPIKEISKEISKKEHKAPVKKVTLKTKKTKKKGKK